jgi:hypothetical protein
MLYRVHFAMSNNYWKWKKYLINLLKSKLFILDGRLFFQYNLIRHLEHVNHYTTYSFELGGPQGLIRGGYKGGGRKIVIFFLHEIPPKFSRLPPFGAIFLSAPPPPLLEILDPHLLITTVKEGHLSMARSPINTNYESS